MPRQKCFAPPQQDGGVAVMHCLDLQYCRGMQVVQKHAAFNLRLDDPTVNFIRQIGMWGEHKSALETRVPGFLGWNKSPKERLLTLKGTGFRVENPESGCTISNSPVRFRLLYKLALGAAASNKAC